MASISPQPPPSPSPRHESATRRSQLRPRSMLSPRHGATAAMIAVPEAVPAAATVATAAANSTAAASSAGAVVAPLSPSSSPQVPASTSPSPLRVTLLSAMHRVRATISSRSHSRSQSRAHSRVQSRATSPTPHPSPPLPPPPQPQLQVAVQDSLPPLSSVLPSIASPLSTLAPSPSSPSAKKLWRTGLLKLWTLRNAFSSSYSGSEDDYGDSSAGGSSTSAAASSITPERRQEAFDNIRATVPAPPISPAPTARESKRTTMKEVALGLANGHSGAVSSPRASGSGSGFGSANHSSAGRDQPSSSSTSSSMRGSSHWDHMMAEHAALNASHAARLEAAGRMEGSNMRAPIQLRSVGGGGGGDGSSSGGGGGGDEHKWAHSGDIVPGTYVFLHLALSKSRLSSIHQLRFYLLSTASSSSSSASNTAQPASSNEELEMFICTTTKAPTRQKFTWRLPPHRGGGGGDAKRMLLLSKQDARFSHGHGHFYIGIHGGHANGALGGLGGLGGMIGYTLRVTASDDTFVPYSQQLQQTNSILGGGVTVGYAGEQQIQHRETTAKNRLANKLSALKHNKAAFDSFQRRVQNIIETRMAAYAQAKAQQLQLQQQGLDELTSSPDQDPSAAGRKPIRIDFVASNKQHTHIGLHSPRSMKKILYSSTVTNQSISAAKLAAASAATAAAQGAAANTASGSEEHPNNGPAELDEASTLEAPNDGGGGGGSVGADDASDGQRSLTPNSGMDDDNDDLGDEEAEDLIDDLLHEMDRDHARGHIASHAHPHAGLTSVEEDREEGTGDNESGSTSPLMKAVSVPMPGPGPSPSTSSSSATTPATGRSPAHAPLNHNHSTNHHHHHSSSSRRPSSSIKSGHSAGLEGSPQSSGASSRRLSRANSHTSPSANVHAAPPQPGFQQVPLTPVNLHLHDMLHARAAAEEEASSSSYPHSHHSYQSPAGLIRRLSSKDQGRSPPHPLPQGLQHIDADVLSLAALSNHIHTESAPATTEAEQDGGGGFFLTAASSSPTHRATKSVGFDVPPPLVSPKSSSNRFEQLNVSLPPVSAAPIAPPVPVVVLAAVPPVPPSVHSTSRDGGTVADSFSFPLANTSSSADADSNSASGLGDDRSVSAVGSVLGGASSIAGRRSRRHSTISRGGVHSRAGSYFTEVSSGGSSSAAGGGIVDTHDALVRTVAAHAAEGGALTATGSARRWIKLPFTGPVSGARRVAAQRRALMLMAQSPSNRNGGAGTAVASARLFPPGEAASATSAAAAAAAADSAVAAAVAAGGSEAGNANMVQFAFVDGLASPASQSARDSKQPVRGSLSLHGSPTAASSAANAAAAAASVTAAATAAAVEARRLQLDARRGSLGLSPEELAAKSALLRQTVENNLKLTQVALNKKPSNVKEEHLALMHVRHNHQEKATAAGKSGGIAKGKKSGGGNGGNNGSGLLLNKSKLTLAAMVSRHGVSTLATATDYETSQHTARTVYMRQSDPAKWTGPRSFAVRKSSGAGIGGEDTSGGSIKHGSSASAAETPFLSSTSKTHRVKLELAYVQRARTNKQNQGSKKEKDAAVAAATAAAATGAASSSDNEAADSPVDDSFVKSAASQPVSPNMARLRASLFRTSSLPLQISTDDPSQLPIAQVFHFQNHHPQPPQQQQSSQQQSPRQQQQPVQEEETHHAGESARSSVPVSPLSSVATSTSVTMPALTLDLPAVSSSSSTTNFRSLDPVLSSVLESPTNSSAFTDDASLSASASASVSASTSAPSSPMHLGTLPSVAEAAVESDMLSLSSGASGQGGKGAGASPGAGTRSVFDGLLLLRPQSLSVLTTDSEDAAITAVGIPSATPSNRVPRSQRPQSKSFGGNEVSIANNSAVSGANIAAPTAASPERDILKFLPTDPYWCAHFYRTAPIPPAVGIASTTSKPAGRPPVPLVVPADNLSLLCLCIDFATRVRTKLDAKAKVAESALLSHLMTQHSLLLDGNAALMCLPVLGADHPVRELVISRGLGPLSSQARWGAREARDHAALTNLRNLSAKLGGELTELEARLKIENDKLDNIRKEAAATAAAAATTTAAEGDATVILSPRSARAKPSRHASQKELVNRLSSSNSSSQGGLVLPVPPKSLLAQQLLSVSSAALLSTPSAKAALAAQGFATSAAAAAAAPKIVTAEEVDIDSTVAQHLSARTLNDWHARSDSSTTIVSNDPRREHKDPSSSSHLDHSPSHRDSHMQSQQSPPSRQSQHPARSSNSATPSQSQYSGRRSGMSSRGSFLIAAPSAAELLYGVSTSILPTSSSQFKPSSTASSSLMSPRTRRVIAQASGGGFLDEEDDEADDASTAATSSSFSFAAPLHSMRHASGSSQRTSVEFKEDHAHHHHHPRDVQHHRFDGGGGDDPVVLSPTGRRRPAATTAASAAPVPSLASSFVRLTRALSNASLATPPSGSLSAPSASASASASTLDLKSPSGSTSSATLGLAEDPASKLARQTRLAKRKQGYASMASDLRLERSADTEEAVQQLARVDVTRGVSVSFSLQLTPIINAVELSSGGGGGSGSSGGSSSVFGGSGGVTRSRYDASHLGHQTQQRAMDAARRAEAPHWQEVHEAGGLRKGARHTLPASPSLSSLSSSSSSAAAAAFGAPLALSDSDFKSHRLIYAKLNYLPLDRIASHIEPVETGNRKH